MKVLPSLSQFIQQNAAPESFLQHSAPFTFCHRYWRTAAFGMASCSLSIYMLRVMEFWESYFLKSTYLKNFNCLFDVTKTPASMNIWYSSKKRFKRSLGAHHSKPFSKFSIVKRFESCQVGDPTSSENCTSYLVNENLDSQAKNLWNCFLKMEMFLRLTIV